MSSHPRTRIRSASVGRDKKSDLQARYWAFLFQNLRRAVDDLYITCEADDSIPAAKEVVLILENYVRDFKNLTDWLKLNWDYENTPPPNRPQSLTWEVRKTSHSPKPYNSLLITSKRVMETAEVIKEVLSPEQELQVIPPLIDNLHKKNQFNSKQSCSDEQSNQAKTSENNSKSSISNPITSITTHNDSTYNGNSGKESYTSSNQIHISENKNEKTLDIKPPGDSKFTESSKSKNNVDHTKSSSTCDYTKVCISNSKPLKSSDSKGVAKLENCKNSSTQSLSVKNQTKSEELKNSKTKNEDSKTVSVSKIVPLSKSSSSDKNEDGNNRLSIKSPTATSKPEGTKVSPSISKTDDSKSCTLVSKTPRSSIITRPRTSIVKRTANTTSSPLLAVNKSLKPVFKPPSSSNGAILNPSKQTINASTKSKTTNVISPKNQRVSLVARQTIKNPSSLKTNVEKHTLKNRSGPVRSISNLVRPTSSFRRNAPSFGSNSSVHSSSSIRSWAETVKGSQEPVTGSVDNLTGEAKVKKSASEEEYGWKTVKSKSRSRNSLMCSSQNAPLDKKVSSYNAKSRFRLPSSAASLPCLLSEEPEDDEKENKAVNNVKIKKANSFNRKPVVSKVNSSNKDKLMSSNSLGKVNEGSFSNENGCGKTIDKIQIKQLTEESVRAHNESLNVAIARKEVAIAEAEQEEEYLVREIIETEKAELTEDTDGDTDVDKRSDSASSTNEVVSSSMTAASTNTPPISFEGLSWVEQIELEDQMESARYPGRAIQLHEKLSSPARKKEPHEAFKAHQEKQIRAQARRSKFQEEKAAKLSALNDRILEVMAKKEQLINERLEMILDKMKKAEVKRQEHIEGIEKKAHEEDAKLKEIAFINELQAQNARIEVMAHNQTSDEKCEGRLAELAEERAKKAEQREAKEARAEEKRRKIELKRIKDVERLKERIRTREERIEVEQKQLRKDRIEAAREKARDREERLSTVRAAEQDMKEELQEKIALKQEIVAKRHKERLELIRTKAFELSVQRGLKDDDSSVPRLQPYDPKKKCEICSVLILNEVQLQSHIRGKLHTENVNKTNEGRLLSKEEIQNCNITRIVDAGDNELDPKIYLKKERSKSMKKKAKKIKNRLLTRGIECEKNFNKNSSFTASSSSSPNRAKIGRALKEIEKLLNSQGKGSWPNSSLSGLDRSLGEISRSFEKRDASDQSAFYHFQGFSYLTKIFNCLAEQKNSCFIPLKSICCVAKIWSEACVEHDSNTEYVLMSNSLILIVEILRERLDLLMPEGLVKNDDIDNDFHHLPDWPIVEPVAQSILDLLTSCLNELTPLAKRRQGDKTEWIARIQDQITYIINIGIVDQLAGYFHKVQDSIDNKPEVGEFILSTLRFLSSLISVVEEVIFPDNPTAIIEDPTCLFTSLRYTDLVGLVSMLYGILLHQDRPPRDTSDPVIKLPEHILKVAFAASRLLHRMVRTNLEMVQVVLGSEGISLEFRHIASYLLWYCLAQEDQVVLLHEIIILVGYFAARHKDNQLIVKSGNQPSILQQLCILPFPYFCQPSLKRILFPSLLACCYENKENLGILAEELNWGFIEDFIKISGGKNHLVQIVLCNPLPSSPPSLQQHKKSPSHTNGNSNICAVQE
ncbi:LOW QUALITY PROTEIN: uncharacterized protein [Lepeophtheirus salmonis]|uniref:LOW QUALITY PROTEIN: uncharacterized protein n=1 Tax=Lepeophtheirus salmonis TaxID=72036 RepID=UPI001AE74714|nr:LOW QUALITY PROTEIN: S phase cyclin A-associated protein in the endoplasmic reticulum-like [Lepeophtheirus salmonis]